MADLPIELTTEEQTLVNKWLSFYDALAWGRWNPETSAQRHFVEVCSGRETAKTSHELAYVKVRMLRARERLDGHTREAPGFASDATWTVAPDW